MTVEGKTSTNKEKPIEKLIVHTVEMSKSLTSHSEVPPISSTCKISWHKFEHIEPKLSFALMPFWNVTIWEDGSPSDEIEKFLLNHMMIIK